MNRIGTIEYIKNFLNYNLKIKKYFGQNFLIDQNVLTNIISKAELNKNVNVIEIGPGLGALTEHLCLNANKVLCYEIDKDLLPILQKNLSSFTNYKVINEDILKADVSKDISLFFDDKPIYLVANLPYYITTPIILSLLEKVAIIKRYVVMMQDEVALRICSKPNVKDYNALSLAIQYRSTATKVLSVSKNSFYPKPNVDSAVVRLDLYTTPPFLATNEEFFFKFIRGCFAQRRKTLNNNLSQFLSKEIISCLFKNLTINPNTRSEQLPLETFVSMANYLTQNYPDAI